MGFDRRRFMQLAAASVLPVSSRMASAQDYPSRPVRLIVPFAAGGVVDVYARMIGQWLSERLGQPFIIENRPGAGGNVGTEVVVKAPPDGYTLLQATTSNAYNATLYENLNFDFVRDIAPVASTHRGLGVMVVRPSFQAKTVPEFITYAKANPGMIIMGSAGIGSSQHIWGEVFKMMAGVDMLHVPYRSGPQALTDLIGGQMQVIFDPLTNSIEHIRSGRLRALAVTAATRAELLPDIPALGDFVPGYEATGWEGICAPRNTPAEIIDRLNKEINAGLSDPKMKTRISALGGTVYEGSPADFGKFIAAETEKWATVIKFIGAKAG